MRKLIGSIMVAMLAIFLGFGQPAFAGQNETDSLLIAKASVMNPVRTYVLQFQYAVLQDGVESWHEIQALYRKNVGMTFLQINGTVITNVTDQNPIKVLPRPQGPVEIRWFWGYANAVGRNNESVQTGFTYDDFLEPGEAIVFDMSLNKVKKFIGYNPNSYEYPLFMRMYDENGWAQDFVYDEFLHGFHVWIDPGQPTHRYEIIGSGGIVIDSGNISHDATAISSTNNGLNFKLRGGVHEVDLKHEPRVSKNLYNLQFEARVNVDGQYVDGAVFAIEKDKNAYGISVSISGIRDIGVIVYGVSANGDLIELPIQNGYYGYDYQNLNVQSIGYEKMILVINRGFLLYEYFSISLFQNGKG